MNTDREGTNAPMTEAKNDGREKRRRADRILGCLLGGAAGDALGYPVEFLRYRQIIDRYGKAGITAYDPDPVTGKVLISDDTQMTLFTAEGLLQPDGDRVTNLWHAYRRWLITQNTGFADRPKDNASALLAHPELFARRAPGTTCLSALYSGRMGTLTDPINGSKGCGGVMRVAPVAFLDGCDAKARDVLAAQAAAITHGHPLGYLPAALLVHILREAICDDGGRTLPEIVTESVTQFESMFAGSPCTDVLAGLVRKAIGLSGNGKSDTENIRELGEGWVAEETLAVSLYCALRHPDDFPGAIIAAVNHDGDSDSTGAVTGNILGAYLGGSRIDARWKEGPELSDVTAEYAAAFAR